MVVMRLEGKACACGTLALKGDFMLWWTLWKLKGQLKSGNADKRHSAVSRLRELRNEKAVELLIAALRDSSGSIREKAAEGLGKIGDTRAVEPLIGLLGDSDYSVRNKAAIALGKIGDKRAVEPLITTLKDSHAFARVGAKEALGTIGDAKAVEPLIAMLKEHKDSGAAEALGRIGDKRAIEPLINLYTNSKSEGLSIHLYGRDSESDARSATVAALGKIKDERVIDTLVAALEDESHYVRESAAGALRGFDLPLELRLATYRIADERNARWKAEKEAQAVVDVTQGSGLTSGVRLESDNPSKTGRRGKCRTCGKVWSLTEAKMECLDWDGVNAYKFYCPDCFKGTRDLYFYTGQLEGSDGEAVIDQYDWIHR